MEHTDPSAVSVTFVHCDGSRQCVAASVGDSLMAAAVAAAVNGIEGRCGGALCCATCHVHVPAEWGQLLTAPADDESDMLQFVTGERTAASRLACQIVVTGDLAGFVVAVPPPLKRSEKGCRDD
jgi:2Fe-2S ferredoxin